MSFCPNCKAEYREGFTLCADCQETLVEALPDEQGSESDFIGANDGTSGSFDSGDPHAFLCTVTDPTEGDIIEALLLAEGIPIARRYRGCGGYLTVCMGAPNLPIDLYVPVTALEEARALLSEEGDLPMEAFSSEDLSAMGFMEMEESDFIDPSEIERKARLRRIMTWISILLFTPGLLVILIVLILQFFF